jgi:hypothetical protein
MLAFSLIARCLSLSFARIGTRSSGIGLFSCQSHKRLCTDDELEAHLEILAKLDQFGLAFIHVALDKRLAFSGEALSFVGNKSNEGR